MGLIGKLIYEIPSSSFYSGSITGSDGITIEEGVIENVTTTTSSIDNAYLKLTAVNAYHDSYEVDENGEYIKIPLVDLTHKIYNSYEDRLNDPDSPFLVEITTHQVSDVVTDLWNFGYDTLSSHPYYASMSVH